MCYDSNIPCEGGDTMLLIECFTASHMDNLRACLQYKPDTLVFLGNGDAMQQACRQYARFLQNRGLRTQIRYYNIAEKDFHQICDDLRKLLNTDKECVIDLTGGDTLAVMAIGAVIAQLHSQDPGRVKLQKYDEKRNNLQDCLTGDLLSCENISLSVEELIALHGGIMHPESFQPPADFTARDLDGLWQIVSDAPKDWNRRTSWLAEFESYADSKTQIYLPLQQIGSRVQNFKEKLTGVTDLLEQFSRNGIIRYYHASYNALEYTYTSSMLRYCTQKAGNVLEVKTLLEARSLLENGAPYFGECCMGVSIDWDGMIHAPAQRIPETRNEIDVVLIHGTTPLFISCKNGHIGEEELYKLHTVATRFGGPGAKKMLIATDLDQKSIGSDRALIQRAWDMDIFPVTEAATLSKNEWQEIFRQAML